MVARLPALALMALLFTACGKDGPPRVDYSCVLEEDCQVKNIGSCCGDKNVCVNANFEPDPEAVRDACGSGDVSDCSNLPVRGCRCVENACITSYGN